MSEKQLVLGPRRQLVDVSGDNPSCDVIVTVLSSNGAPFTGAIVSQTDLDIGTDVDMRNWAGEMRVRVTNDNPEEGYYVALESVEETNVSVNFSDPPYEPKQSEIQEETQMEEPRAEEAFVNPVAPTTIVTETKHNLDQGVATTYLTIRNCLIFAAILAIGIAVYYLWVKKAPGAVALATAAVAMSTTVVEDIRPTVVEDISLSKLELLPSVVSAPVTVPAPTSSIASAPVTATTSIESAPVSATTAVSGPDGVTDILSKLREIASNA